MDAERKRLQLAGLEQVRLIDRAADGAEDGGPGVDQGGEHPQ